MNSVTRGSGSHGAARLALPVFLCATAFALFACAPKADGGSADSASVAPDPAPATPSNAAALAVTEFGYGALKVGVPFATANDSLKGALVAAAGANLAECDYVKWEGGPASMLVMVVGGKIGRVEVSDSTIPTDVGARVGDSEERIKSLYAGRVTVTPHKYTDGHYLTVRAANAADSLNLIIFETDGSKVITYRAGIVPAVQYIEGCS